jgi:hypothetical protein
LEHRESSIDFGRSPHIYGWDHWVVVCQSHPKSGPFEEITFDYWEDRPAAESPTHFRNEYPNQLGGTLKGGSIDCGGNVTPGPSIAFPTPHK